MISWRRRHPLACGALAAVCGILASDAIGWGLVVWAGLALVVLVTWTASRPGASARAVWSFALLLCLFGGLHQRRLAATRGHPLLARLEAEGTVSVEVEARVLRAALPSPAAAEDGGEARAPQRARLDLLADTVRLKAFDEEITLPCRLRAWVTPELAALAVDRCRMTGMLLPLRSALNEGEFSARDFGLRSGVVAGLQVQAIHPQETSWWQGLPRRLRDTAESCREFIRRQLALGLSGRPAELAVMQAMALGASEDTDPRVEEPFRRSGTLHVFAVSGLHVGLICLILRRLLRPLRLRRPVMVAMLVPLVFAYAFITGWRPSAARAALMIALLLIGTLAQRRGALLNSLGAAALLLLAWDTHTLFLPGFQLSFGVLLAIALLGGWFHERMRPWVELDPFLPPSLATNGQRLALAARQFAAGLLGTSSAAWLGSLPLMWVHFHTVTPVALMANCLLVPCAFVCLSLACLSLGLSLLPGCTGLQTGLNQINGHCASLMLASAGRFASLPGASLHLPPPSRWFGRGDFELNVLALPFGAEAALLRARDRFWMLDAGSAADFGRVALPALRRAGVNRLNGLVLSHADAAHVGGAEPLLRAFPVTVVHHSMHEPWRQDSSATSMRRLLEKTAPLFPRSSFQPLGLEQTATLSPHLHPGRLTVLYPAAEDRRPLADDRGLVALIEVGALRILWTADAGFVTESTLLARQVNLRCDVLLRGAHGSDHHGTAAFLEAASPRLILNAGPEHPPGGKAPAAVREHARRHAVPLLFLSEHGGVTLRMKNDSARHVEVRAFKSGLRLDLPLGP